MSYWQNKPEVHREWQSRRDKGEHLWSIALDYDCTRQTVAKYTVGTTKTRKGPKRTQDYCHILKLTDKGLSDSTIAKRLGCSKSYPAVVRYNLKCRNSTLNPIGGSEPEGYMR